MITSCCFYPNYAYTSTHKKFTLNKHGKVPGDELPPFGDVMSSLIKNRKLKHQIELWKKKINVRYVWFVCWLYKFTAGNKYASGNFF